MLKKYFFLFKKNTVIETKKSLFNKMKCGMKITDSVNSPRCTIENCSPTRKVNVLALSLIDMFPENKKKV